MLSGDFRAGLGHSAAAAVMFREVGIEGGLVTALGNCGWSALCLGDHALADESFRDALVIHDRLGWIAGIATLTVGLAAVSVAQGKRNVPPNSWAPGPRCARRWESG